MRLLRVTVYKGDFYVQDLAMLAHSCPYSLLWKYGILLFK